MNLSESRRSRGILFFILLCIPVASALLLSSCRAQESSGGDKDGLSSALSSVQIRTQTGQGALYDISGPAGAGRGGDLCCAGLYDETRLLLLRADRGDSGAVTGYRAELLDLYTLQSQPLLSFARATVPGEKDDGPEGTSDGSAALSLLSCDPVILHDSQNGILYFPGASKEAVTLPSCLREAVPYYLGGRLWLSCDRGLLLEVTADGDLRTAWELPCEYGAFTPVVCGHENRLSFATWARRDPSLQVYVDVDPESGQSEYYLSDLNPSRFTVARDGLLLGSSFRTTPAVSVCDPSAHTKKELSLPQEILDLLRADAPAASSGENDTGNKDTWNNDTFLSFSTFPLSLCGDLCCFGLCDEAGRPIHIYLWDAASCRATDWTAPSVSEYTPPQSVDYADLTEKAQELERQYGVRILFGENIPAEFADYTAETFTDTPTIAGSLSVLENVLSLYPQNYFTKLKGLYYRNIAFYLTGALKPLNSAGNISNASAFATPSCGTMQLAFDLYDDLSPDTVIHELTHAADYRFAGEGLWDEEAWNRMNPEGFSYYYSYIDENGESYETAGSSANTAVSGCPADDVWFIDPYSKTYPMEDRARLMEVLLSGDAPVKAAFKGRHLQQKLEFYFRFLRETLGDESWPAQTSWEEALRAAASAK